MTTSPDALSKTDGDATTPPKNLNTEESGVEFGLRPRTPGLLYLPKFPPPELSKLMLQRDNYMCTGVVVFGNEKWLQFEVREPPPAVPHVYKKTHHLELVGSEDERTSAYE
jgi:hypothetical protein